MVAPTITTSPGIYKIGLYKDKIVARRFTVREIGRLMGVSDTDIDKLAEVNTKTKLIEQFGNSIVVPVLEAIFRQLHIKGVEPWNKEI